MTELIVDALKTGVVQQRGLKTRITKEAVQSMARPLDGQAIPILVDHDPSGMPHRQSKGALVLSSPAKTT